MAKKKKPRIVEEEKVDNTFAVRRKNGESMGFVRAFRFSIESEFEGRVAQFFDESEELVAAIRDWEEIRKLDDIAVKRIMDDLSEELHDKLEKVKQTGAADELPENWGKVNGQKF